MLLAILSNLQDHPDFLSGQFKIKKHPLP